MQIIETFYIYLENTSFNSCSDTNCPRLATKSVEQGAFVANDGFVVLFAETTGLARDGLDKNWWWLAGRGGGGATLEEAAVTLFGPVAALPCGKPAVAVAAAVIWRVVGCKAVADWWCCGIVIDV